MPRKTKNILFIMFDQLRWDYLSCAGHKTLHTPHIDALAAKGMRFSRAYVQSPICGSSRMSFYTGRYVHSHGASWNNIPLKVGEMTMGDHLRNCGMNSFLVGKTHMRADAEGMARLGLDPDSVIGARVKECGFDVFERDDGMRPEGPDGLYDEDNACDAYNDYLRAKGYKAENPWHDFANSAVSENGNILSGWFYKNASEPANIKEEDSETPYMIRRGIDFIKQAPDTPWLCHLSLIKPHWPYIVPAPYHNIFSPRDIQPLQRHADERTNAHPVLNGFITNPIGQAFQRHEVREAVIPAYMGLIKQCDDQIGVLMQWLEETGKMQDTMIVLTSDHGDYLGDHWMGEKTFFHDQAIKVPMIIYDPSAQADATRGQVCDALVESIDLTASFIEAAGGDLPDHIVEGRSLLPILHGKTVDTGRDYAICEYDYSGSGLAEKLGLSVRDAVIFSVITKEWKLIHCEGGFAPLLFDLVNDPQEYHDLGGNQTYAPILEKLYDMFFAWARRPAQRTTRSEAQLVEMRGKSGRRGVVLGVYDENDIDLELTIKYRGKAPKME